MRRLDVFWIGILRKNDCVRKVPNANKLIKTKGFLMISWFARFKNRFGKLQKNMKKRCRKSEEKGSVGHKFLAPFWSHFPSKIDEKIDAKIDAEKVMNFMKNPCEI